jgi:hypothetical protein
MAFKIGRTEIGLRLLLSLTAIAIAYGYIGSYLSTLLRYDNYPIAVLLLALAVAGVFAIAQSLGGLLAAIAAVAIVYWQSRLNSSLITAGVCLGLYLLSFQDLRYDPEPDKKLSITEIIATVITLTFTVTTALIILHPPAHWSANLIIGAIAGAITLVGKQLEYIDLSEKTILRLLGIVSGTGLAIGFAITAIFYATSKPMILI